MRIKEHPVLGVKDRGKEITIEYNGEKITAYEGETIAAALWASGKRVARHTHKKDKPRGLFCAIGYCSDCLMTVNGKSNIRTCVTLVEDGMTVETQKGYGFREERED